MLKNRALAVDIDMRTIILTVSFAFLALALTACSSNYDDSATPGMTDPFENVNRAVFKFNEVVDDAVINPVIDGYRYVVPRPARTGVSNFLDNLQSPVYLFNHVLQGDAQGAARVTLRAIVNTMVGFGGVFDFAGAEGYEHAPEDFGQTLGVWGVDHGPYIVVPILGPSSARDYAGYFIDSFADPLRWYAFNVGEEHLYYTKTGARYLELRNSLKDNLEELQASSIDYYASVRSSYYQVREGVITDRAATAAEQDMVPSFPDYGDF